MIDAQIAIIMHESEKKLKDGFLNNLIKEGNTVLYIDYYGKEIISSNSLLKIYNPSNMSIVTLASKIKEYDDIDYIVINGVERVVASFNNQKEIYKKEYSKISFRTSSQKSLSFEKFSELIEKIRSNIENHKVLIIIDIEKDAQENIIKVFENDDEVEILSLKSENNEFFEVQKMLLEELDKRSYKEMYELIDKYLQDQNLTIRNIFKSHVALKHGHISDAIEYLKVVENDLDPNSKLMLADLYYFNKEFNKAFNICCVLFEEDKFSYGLLPKLAKFLLEVENLEISLFKNWLDKIILMESNDIVVLNYLANGMNKIKDYQKASKIRRSIFKLNQDPKEELLARMLDLLNNLPIDPADSKGYIKQLIQDYPELDDEAHYRLGLLFLNHYKSIYLAFEQFNNVTYDSNFIFAYEVAVQRLNLIEDDISAAKVFKINLNKDSNGYNYRKLLEKKTLELVRNLESLSINSQGPTIWENFLTKSYTDFTWKRQLDKLLLEEINLWNEFDENLVMKSYIYKIESNINVENINIENNPHAAFYVLRNLKSSDSIQTENEDELLDCIKGCLIMAEITKDEELKIWIIYEVAIILSSIGKDQEAINQAYRIFELTKDLDRKLLKKGRMLAFIALGNAKYRLGNIVESIAMVIIAMKLSVETEEYGAFVEEGMNIIYRLHMDNSITMIDKDTKILIDFYEKFSEKIDKIHSDTRIAAISKDFNKIYKDLKTTVYEMQHNNEWSINFANYLAACVNTGNEKEALNLIINNGKIASKLLKKRRDMLSKCLQSWAQILILTHDKSLDLKDQFLLAKDLLFEAVENSETRRMSISHKSERAYLADDHRSVIIDYLEILAILYSLKDVSIVDKKYYKLEILKCFNILTSRSIIETKVSDNSLSEEMIEKQKHYLSLWEELKGLTLNDPFYQELAKKFNILDAELKKNHPSYMPLPNLDYSLTSENIVELQKNQIFLQYVLGNFGIIVLLIDKDQLIIEYTMFDSKEYRKGIEILSSLLQSYEKSSEEQDKIMYAMCDELSKPVINTLEKLLEVEKENASKEIYICPDSSFSLFSTNLFRSNREWLNKKHKIINILDFSQISVSTEINTLFKSSSILIVTLGPINDKAINIVRSKIENWSNNYKVIHLELAESKNEILEISDKCKEINPNLLVVIGHGVADNNSGHLSGTIGISGNKRNILGGEFSILDDLVDQIMIISCSGGAHYENQIETSNGILNNILSRKFKNIVLCKWDVNALVTFEILESIIAYMQLDGNLELLDAILKSQRVYQSSENWHNPFFWAGLEYWKN